MQSFYFVLAVLVALNQRSHASYEHVHGLEGVPIAEPMPFVAASAPVMAAPPIVMAAAPIQQFAVADHHHEPAEVHNRISSYQRETGHLADTGMLLPFKSRRRAAKKVARARKNLQKNKS